MRRSAMQKTAAVACALLASLTAAPVGVAQTRAAVSMGAAPQMINLPRGTSFAVDLPADARDVIVSNPQVAEAMLHSPRRITVIGIMPGETDAVFLDAAGRTILSLRVRVDAGTSALQDTLSRVAPGGQIHAEAVNDSVILTGFADSPAQAAQAARVAAAFVSAPEKVINMISVVGSDQVTLRVRVVEVQRSALKQLGFSSDILKGAGIHSYGFSRPNTYGVNGAPAGGSGLCYGQNGGRTTNFSNSNSSSSQTGSTATATSGDQWSSVPRSETVTVRDVNGNLVQLPGTAVAQASAIAGTTNAISNAISNIATTAFQTMTGTNASGCLEAFERVGLARTLAEPNLTSVNGESANFLAGGEFPLPTGRDRDGNITVTYKPYGVGLAFRPVVMSGGRISLQVKVEVSELTAQGGFTIGAGTPSSITLPGLTVRRSENTVELPSGGSMMIAGLLQETTRQTVDSLPGVTNLPVLGSLFRSRDYLMGETELVVIVEPYIVSPTSPDRMQTPADGLRIASDSQTILFGQLNQVYGLPNAPPAGSVGYVIE
ncbi:type II and III secretion system protein family protein [Brevundimonas intermedia]|uniref:Type II and III secretion system protein family protein n=1 Tax=Brevundimonas intermedia TaxID=74315 RepID=A0A4Y9RZG3_9CAUL|nr:type II and III secretion system protein family protein [Brevundimonas intermedia]TFW14540.1 type II and III secretion system protein family protein [Brevundimonas intermedia]